MAITTTVTWNPVPSDAVFEFFNQEALVLSQQGKTDDTVNISWPAGSGIPPKVAVRPWTTVEDAQAWIDFVTPYNPQSAVINNTP